MNGGHGHGRCRRRVKPWSDAGPSESALSPTLLLPAEECLVLVDRETGWVLIRRFVSFIARSLKNLADGQKRMFLGRREWNAKVARPGCQDRVKWHPAGLWRHGLL